MFGVEIFPLFFFLFSRNNMYLRQLITHRCKANALNFLRKLFRVTIKLDFTEIEIRNAT